MSSPGTLWFTMWKSPVVSVATFTWATKSARAGPPHSPLPAHRAPHRRPCRVPLHHRRTTASPSTAAGREDEPEWGHGPELHLLAHAERGRRAAGREEEPEQGRGLELDLLTQAEREEERWVVRESVERRVKSATRAGGGGPGRGDPADGGDGSCMLRRRGRRKRERKEKGERIIKC
jgi:hypothetical protein